MTYHDRPLRPRSHEIETASKKAFEQWVPNGWVVREKSHDYGIDLEVEIFDDGRATGLVFLVQLKGTDDVGDAVKVPINLATLAYMADLRLPVLVVRYLAPDGRLFGRWAQTINVPADRQHQKTISVGFDTSHEFDSDTVAELVASVVAFRAMFVDRRLPLTVYLELSDDFFDSRAAGEVNAALRAHEAMLAPLVRIDAAPPDTRSHARSSVIVEPARIAVMVVGRTVTDVMLPSRPTGHDVMVAVALAMSSLGFEANIATLLDTVVDGSQLADRDDVEATRWQCLLAANRALDALARIEHRALRTYAAGTDDTYVNVGLTALLGRAHCDPAFGQEHMVPVLDRLADALVTRGQPERASAHVYNSANALRVSDRCGFRSVVARYRRAARLDPSYLERAYWWAELGGILFELRRYRAAADCYERALSLGMRGRWLALTADAQWHAGRYRQAITNFEAYEAELVDVHDPELAIGSTGWCLTRRVLSFAVALLGIEAGPLRGGMDDYRGDDEPDNLLAYLRERGILHPRIWFNYGGSSSLEGDTSGAFVGFLMAALLVPADQEAWANALGVAFNMDDADLIGHLLEETLFRHGQGFIDYFVDSRIPGDDEQARSARRTLRRDLMSHLDGRHGHDTPIVIRIGGRSLTELSEEFEPSAEVDSNATTSSRSES